MGREDEMENEELWTVTSHGYCPEHELNCSDKFSGQSGDDDDSRATEI